MTGISSYLFPAILFAAPAWLINMSLNAIYVVKSRYPDLVQFDLPIDNQWSWGGKRILGNSTTWAGLLVAIVAAVVCSVLFSLTLNIALIYGVCVYFGHALGSFIKRRLGLTGGAYLPIVDHGDYIFLAGLVFYLEKKVDLHIAIIALAVTLVVHPIVTYISYKLNLKKYPH